MSTNIRKNAGKLLNLHQNLGLFMKNLLIFNTTQRNKT